MKAFFLASACILTLSSPAAFAQTGQPSNATGTQNNMGTSSGAMKDGTMNPGTTGMTRQPSAAGDASTSGAPSGVPANNTGSATEPGAVQKGVNQR